MGNEACENAVIESVKAFKGASGSCIVENSTIGINRKTSFLKKVSQETGVHIIAGSGLFELASKVVNKYLLPGKKMNNQIEILQNTYFCMHKVYEYHVIFIQTHKSISYFLT